MDLRFPLEIRSFVPMGVFVVAKYAVVDVVVAVKYDVVVVEKAAAAA